MAAHAVRIFLDDGSVSYLSLSTGGIALEDFTPSKSVVDPSGVQPENPPPVIESLTIALMASAGGSLVTARGYLETIGKYIEYAKFRVANGYGPRVYLGITYSYDTAEYRSELYGGEIEPVADYTTQTAGGALVVRLNLLRHPAGYETALVSGFLKPEASGSYSTSLITLNTYDDNTHDNAALLQSPTSGYGTNPVILTVQPSTSWTGPLKLFVGIEQYGLLAYSTAPAVLDDKTSLTAGTVTAAANTCEGQWTRYPIAPPTQKLVAWTLSAATVQTLLQRPVRLFLVLKNALSGSTVRVKCRVLDELTQTNLIWETRWANLVDNEYIYDLGVVQLPADTMTMGNAPAAKLRINFYFDAEVATNIDLDFICLFPTTPGNFQWVEVPSGVTFSSGDKIIFDGDNQRALVYDSVTSTYMQLANIFGDPLRFQNNLVTKFRFLLQTASGATTSDIRVQMQYRPRRLSV